MKIGIIGAGHIGAALAKNLVKLGHHVSIANSRGPETLAEVASATGAAPVGVREAARAGEVVIVTIPQKNIPDLPRDLFDGVSDSVAVIDTGNYYPGLRDGDLAPRDSVDSVWVAQQLGRPVIKVFNSIYAASLANKGAAKGTPGRIALAVSGDDARTKSVVLELVDALGFDPVDNGPLSNSWRQQIGSPGYCLDLDKAKLTAALASAEPSKIAQYRHAADEHARSFVK